MKTKKPICTFELRVAFMRGFVLKHALKLTRNPDDANDLTQDVMLQAIKSKDKFADDSNLAGWLAVITKNLFCTQYQKRQKTTALHLTDDPTGEHPSVFEYLDRKDRPWTDLTGFVDDVDAVLAGMDRKNRKMTEPFRLHVKGFKYEEIAAYCDIPVGTVKNRIHRCRELLKQELYMYAA